MDEELFAYKYPILLAPFDEQMYCSVRIKSKVINVITCMDISSKN